ncbi:transcriptional enhancer factor TEF-4 [Trichinella spiralis]|uniref:transcriptional enhancer factor TEF-4 n=1 Tax=Trichinella spiralis TaxID=6334 RepID=UPI0001EFD728|nr:transcriptional enhancer factor TEF-4 [Trichinella spiralis]
MNKNRPYSVNQDNSNPCGIKLQNSSTANARTRTDANTIQRTVDTHFSHCSQFALQASSTRLNGAIVSRRLVTVKKHGMSKNICFEINRWRLQLKSPAFKWQDKQIFFLLIFYRVERFDSCEAFPNTASGIADACKQSQPPIIR